jgi:hypothetical protein
VNAFIRSAVVVNAAFLFSLVPNVVIAAPAGQLALRWSELHPLLNGRQIAVRLTDGATVEGKYSSLQADTLSIQVKQTSDPAKHPKGATSLARPELAQITVKRHSGWKGRIIGLIAGGAAGAIAGAIVFAHYGFYADVAAGGGAGAIGIGYLVGWLIDHARARPEQVVQILPDQASR